MLPSAIAGLLLVLAGLETVAALGVPPEEGSHGRGREALLLEVRRPAHRTDEALFAQQIPVIHPLEDGKEEFTYVHRSAETLPETMYRALKGTAADFLPNWHFQSSTFIVSLATLAISSIWFVIYHNYLYSDDRTVEVEDVAAWAEVLEAVRATREEQDDLFRPDLIIVAHHPSHPYTDGDREVKFDTLDRILVSGTDNMFSRTTELRERAQRRYLAGHVDLTDISSLRRASAENFLQSLSKGVNSRASRRRQSDDVDEEPVLRKDVRKALMQDLYKVLPLNLGVDVTVFKSIDNDELFICLTLKKRRSINYFLARDRVCLPLSRELMKILPDAEGEPIQLNWVEPSCAPPLMPFDPMVVDQLYDNTFGTKLPEDDVERVTPELKLYCSDKLSGKKSCISSKECVRILYDELSSSIDVGAAVDEGLLRVWFPVHNPYSIQELQAIWASWRLVLDMSFVQPVPYLREYFGARMAFLFAWNGVVCKAMLPLILLAFVWLITVRIANWAEYSKINERQVIGFSMVLCIWSKITVNLWSREQAFFTELWGLQNSHDEGLVRPQFRGTLMPSPLNHRQQERQYPASRAKARRVIAAVFTSLFCGMVFFFVIATLLLFSGRKATMMPFVLAFMIKIFQFIFQFVVKALTEFENHKFQEDYFNSYLWKLFLFEFVNNYSAFFFLTIKNSWNPAQENGLAEPQEQVSMTLMLLAVCSVMQVPFELVKVQFLLWYEDYTYRNQYGQEPPERSFYEEQAKMITIDEPYEVQNMMTLVIALGYVLLFGGVAPRVVLFCFVVFVVQLRSFAVLLTTSAQRTFPQKAQGIGNWDVVVLFLVNCGVIYSGFLFVAFGKTFKHADMMAKMTGFVIFLVGMYTAWGVIDLFFPPIGPEVGLLAKRRSYIMRMIMKLTSRDDLNLIKRKSMEEVDLEFADAVENENWDQIPLRLRSAREEKDFNIKKLLSNSASFTPPGTPRGVTPRKETPRKETPRKETPRKETPPPGGTSSSGS